MWLVGTVTAITLLKGSGGKAQAQPQPALLSPKISGNCLANQTRLLASRMLRLVCFTNVCWFLLLTHVICYNFCCKRCMGLR